MVNLTSSEKEEVEGSRWGFQGMEVGWMGYRDGEEEGDREKECWEGRGEIKG